MTNNRSSQALSSDSMLPSAYGRNPSKLTVRVPAGLGTPQIHSAPRQTQAARRKPTEPAMATMPTSRANRSRGHRLLLPALAGVVLLLAGVLLIGTGIAGARTNRDVAKPTHTVAAGETLWSIARSVKPHGDVRPLVAKIARLNRVGHTLEPGATLLLP